jgi:uncharacterized membrane protein YfcA
MFALDWVVSVAGFAVGSIVGMTGMGGGALMTPVLVLLFGVPPSVAVGSDLAASLVMKPLGAAVHLKRGTVHRPLVRNLVIGSVPAAFAGAATITHVGSAHDIDVLMKTLLGATLLVAAGAALLKEALKGRHTGLPPGASQVPFSVKPVHTIVVGVIGGFIVGLTSVGSGSLVIVMLMLLYPRLSGSRLVGTDLVQAIPLVAAAALGHALFGQVKLSLTASLLVGSLPGVYLGALVSSRAPDRIIRPTIVVVLVASALKLLGASNPLVLGVSLLLIAGAVASHVLRRSEAPHAAAPASPAPSQLEAPPAE